MANFEFQEILNSLNPEQLEAVQYNEGPLLIVAGAGTGKTHLVTTKMAYLILEKKYETDNILALTFTEKAAAEMEDRILKLLPYGYLDLWVHTFHGFAERVLRENALYLSMSSDFKILDDKQLWLFFYKNLDYFNLKEFYEISNPKKHIINLLKHFSKLKDELISPEQYLDWVEELKLNSESIDFLKKNIVLAKNEEEDLDLYKSKILRYEELAQTYKKYQELLHKHNYIDFADMVYYVYKLFKENPLILKKYQKQFKHIIVDEFQDTNYGQYELVKLLTANRREITVVGDDDQSIYKFRGASIFNILEFKDDYPDAKEVVLIKNYRSGQEILDLAYKSIQFNNPYRLESKLNLNKNLESQTSFKAKVNFQVFEHNNDEKQFVLDEILKLSKEDSDFKWGDVAILASKNAILEDMAQFLSASNIPFQNLSGKGLYYKNIIIDIIDYFRLLDDYHESVALYRILSLEFLDISKLALLELSRLAEAEHLSLWEACHRASTLKISEDDLNKIQKVLYLIEKHSKLALRATVIEVLLAFLRDFEYLDYLLTEENEKKQESLWYLQLFVEKIQDFEKSAYEKNLKYFMEILELEMEAGDTGDLRVNPEYGPDYINLLTIHKSKGLEFKYVFLISLDQNTFPGRLKTDNFIFPEPLLKERADEYKDLTAKDLDIQEKRRLFYVAITRAKQNLYLTYAKNKEHLSHETKMSLFLTELGFVDEEIRKTTINQSLLFLTNMQVEKEVHPDFYKDLLKSFSYTKLKTYDDCPYKFYLQYVLKIPSYQSSANMVFGNVMHNTFYKFLDIYRKSKSEQLTLLNEIENQELKVNKDLLLKIFEETWTDAGYDSERQREEYKKIAYKILNNFYEDFESNTVYVKDLERKLRWKSERLGVELNARFDRVDYLDEKKEAFYILDYKTGKTKTSLKKEDKYQLIIYYLLAKAVYGQSPINLVYLYLTDYEKLKFVPKEKEIEDVYKWILDIVTGIKNKNFKAKSGEFTCKYCPYFKDCPYKK